MAAKPKPQDDPKGDPPKPGTREAFLTDLRKFVPPNEPKKKTWFGARGRDAEYARSD